jgi:hypothetical protein
LRGGNYEGIRVVDNVIDVPEFVPGGYVPELAGSLSLTFLPMARWVEDAKAGRVVYRDNRDASGKRLDPILIDWDYQNPPHWGRSQGAVAIPKR